jgi:hypothetical protein
LVIVDGWRAVAGALIVFGLLMLFWGLGCVRDFVCVRTSESRGIATVLARALLPPDDSGGGKPGGSRHECLFAASLAFRFGMRRFGGSLYVFAIG